MIGYLELLHLLGPEIILTGAALLVLAVDLLWLRELEAGLRSLTGSMLLSVGCVAAFAFIYAVPAQGNYLLGMLVVDPLTNFGRAAILLLTLATAWLPHRFTRHIGEYFALLAFAALGMLFLIGSENILMLFIALELTSLSLYLLAGFATNDPRSAEASLKYFLIGGTSAAFTLFGLSLIYGLSGELYLPRIAAALQCPDLDPLLVIAIVMTMAGLAFKVAAAPFHLWAPDAYEGAPVPAAAFIASGSKVAGFFVLAKVALIGFKGAGGSAGVGAFIPGWVPLLAALAVLSMLLGNLAALAQKSVRRLLAYSAVAHAGYMLLAVLSGQSSGFVSLVYYVVTYGLTTLGAFTVVGIVRDQVGGDRLSDFAGLARRSPLLGFCMLVFLLSLAGIPPLAGFFGKFYVFSAVLRVGSGDLSLWWLVAMALAMSAVSLYYYLQVLKQVYVVQPEPGFSGLQFGIAEKLLTTMLAAAVVVLGCFPELVLSSLNAAVQAAGL